MSAIVAEGERLLAERAAMDQRMAAEAQALAELRTTAPAILDLLATIVHRQDQLEQMMTQCMAMQQRQMDMTMATRIRRPVRDASGAIKYVVDEMNPPPALAAMTEGM